MKPATPSPNSPDGLSFAQATIAIACDLDIVEARTTVRRLASQVGFREADLVMIATAVSEVARNILEHAETGEMLLSRAEQGVKRGVEVIARDQGPGIADVSLAMQDGFTTARGLGIGLPGARRLMDDFEIVTQIGAGTTITMRKWLR